MPFPFEVEFEEVHADLDTYVDAVFGCLESEFLVMPKGEGFVEFPAFEEGYEGHRSKSYDSSLHVRAAASRGARCSGSGGAVMQGAAAPAGYASAGEGG